MDNYEQFKVDVLKLTSIDLNYYKENVDKKPLSQLIDVNYGSCDNTRRPLAWTEEKHPELMDIPARIEQPH